MVHVSDIQKLLFASSLCKAWCSSQRNKKAFPSHWGALKGRSDSDDKTMKDGSNTRHDGENKENAI